MEPLVCIVNPKSAGGRTERAWPDLARRLEAAGLPFTVRHTAGPGDGTRLAREAIEGGARTVVAVGGDGTIHDVVNGFFDGETPIHPEARLGILPAGSGSDLIKTLGVPRDAAGAIAVLARNEARRIDLGRVSYRAHEGGEVTRYFINTASAGMSGAALEAMAHLPTFLAGTAAYVVGSIQTILTFRGFDAAVRVDGESLAIDRAVMIVVGNGRYFGSGMKALPDAAIDDGLFDVLVIKERPLLELLINFPRLYAGTVNDHPMAVTARARRVAITGERALPVEVDGEQPGTTPMVLEMVPGALSVLG
ncbi:MAG: diacylglycerol/lipid kinase family protein [Candidatus Sericytochromatia bacterium]